MTFQQTYAELLKTIETGKSEGLKNIEVILDRLLQNEDFASYLKTAKIIHVTGTNGKGSTCKMLSSIYTEKGLNVGLFTSPHIDTIRERIQVQNELISEKNFVSSYKEIKKICSDLETEGIHPSYFEWIFAMALIHFYKSRCTLVIVEVGIGGRVDATNILPQTTLSCMTSIGLDHMDRLGNTIEAIAQEKAGIIRENGVCVYNNKNDKVTAVITEVGQKKKARMIPLYPAQVQDIKYIDKHMTFSIKSPLFQYENIQLRTQAKYQTENTLCALTIIHTLMDQFPVTEEQIREGLKDFSFLARFEQVRQDLYIDGAHNALGIQKLLISMKTVTESFDVLLSVKDGKTYEETIRLISSEPQVNTVYIAPLESIQSVSTEALQSAFLEKQKKAVPIEQLNAFIIDWIHSPHRPLLCTGSLYLASEVRRIVQVLSYDR